MLNQAVLGPPEPQTVRAREMVWTADALRALLSPRTIDRPEDWVAALPSRKRAERDFHNASKRTRESETLAPGVFERLHGNKKYYSVVDTSRELLAQWLAGYVSGRIFLDFACGEGDQIIEAVRMGAALAIGVDISDASIAKARAHAVRAGVESSCLFIQGDCERTELPDGCVDVVLCSGMLHHLDLSYALPELRRILKAGGSVLAVEALNCNPAIALYRHLTPQMRTEWEKHHILGPAALGFAAHFFDVREVRFLHLFVLLAMVVRPVPALFDLAVRVLDRLDAIVLRIPGVRWMAWQFTFRLVKRLDE